MWDGSDWVFGWVFAGVIRGASPLLLEGRLNKLVRVLLPGLVLWLGLAAVAFAGREVVVYTSVDQVVAAPVLADFEKASGIAVRAVYDVEASKTVGLVNRLVAEKDRPRCDVFWNSEASRTLVLAEKGLLAPYRSREWDAYPDRMKDSGFLWTGFAGRARVLIVNTRLVEPKDIPRSIFELTQPRWKGKVTMAYPLFGTTAMHVAALWSVLGPDKTVGYLKGMLANGLVVVDGNSVTRDLVAEGKAAVGFTDTDDAQGAIAKGAPVQMVFPDQDSLGTLLIPNTVAMIAGAPHPDTAGELIDFLLSAKTEQRLLDEKWAQVPLRKDAKGDGGGVKAMEVDLGSVARNLTPSARACQELFVR